MREIVLDYLLFMNQYVWLRTAKDYFNKYFRSIEQMDHYV